MHIDQPAIVAGHLQQPQQSVVVDDLVAVRHIDLERRKPVLDQSGHLGEYIVTDIGDYGVEPIIDDGVRLDFAQSPVARQGQRLPPALKREVDDRRDASACPRDRTGKEVVRGRDSQAVDGVGEMRVGVDAAGHYPVPARIQDLAIRVQVRAHISHPSVANQDITCLHAVRRHHRAAGNQQFSHGRSHVPVTPGLAPMECANRGPVNASPCCGESLLGLRDNADIGQRLLPAIRIPGLGGLVGHRRQDDHVLPILPVGRGGDLFSWP